MMTPHLISPVLTYLNDKASKLASALELRVSRAGAFQPRAAEPPTFRTTCRGF
jgi:hypothetical protein